MSDTLPTQEKLIEIAEQAGTLALLHLIQAGNNSSLLVLDDEGETWEITAKRKEMNVTTKDAARRERPLPSPLTKRSA